MRETQSDPTHAIALSTGDYYDFDEVLFIHLYNADTSR